ncbi:MAG TPA: hypothetical protein DCE23_00545 [Firmicutes bacterium]|nr:hypothetical protein [Bacillota bacterium]
MGILGDYLLYKMVNERSEEEKDKEYRDYFDSEIEFDDYGDVDIDGDADDYGYDEDELDSENDKWE